MPYGTVKWFNKKTGAGLILTDDGVTVIFLNGDIQDSDPRSIYNGSRVSLDILKGRSGTLGAINVKAAEIIK
jgi:cold shock CspA family protein